ncbi:hypothetical protein D8P29_24480, partial [Salmonella enterica]|nr:hypothetical protein [Salmonella enterica]
MWVRFRLLQENVQQQGWRTYLYDAEQPYTPVVSVTGKGESRQVWYYHTDVTGTPQEVTAADGTLVWAGYIRGFGENAADISNSGAYFHQPLRLPGQYFDDETGLHYNLFRYYAPECGRFVSQDPIGLAGGLNLYQYAPNPLTWIDPLGLDRYPSWMPTRQGYNRHHIIPYEFRNHPFLQRTNIDINGATNMTYLPVADGIHPTKVIHADFKLDGLPHSDYNKKMGGILDALEERAILDGWDNNRATKEALNLQSDT